MSGVTCLNEVAKRRGEYLTMPTAVHAPDYAVISTGRCNTIQSVDTKIAAED